MKWIFMEPNIFLKHTICLHWKYVSFVILKVKQYAAKRVDTSNVCIFDLQNKLNWKLVSKIEDLHQLLISFFNFFFFWILHTTTWRLDVSLNYYYNFLCEIRYILQSSWKHFLTILTHIWAAVNMLFLHEKSSLLLYLYNT